MAAATGITQYSVSFEFPNAELKVNDTSLQEQLKDKADFSHTHSISAITDYQTDITTKLANYVPYANTDKSINLDNGIIECKDIQITIDDVPTKLGQLLSSTELNNEEQSHTVQHLTLTCDPNIKVGYPVFLTGQVVGAEFTVAVISSTDCVPIVQSSGDWHTFVGICTEVDVNYKNKTTMWLGGKKHAFIRYATHGDFQMVVNDTSLYRVGDLITYEGEIVTEDTPITYRIINTIIGRVSSIIDSTGT